MNTDDDSKKHEDVSHLHEVKGELVKSYLNLLLRFE